MECPNSTDVIFKLGKNTKAHPGNTRFHSLIQSKYKEYINVRYDEEGNDKLLQHPLTYTTTTTALDMTTKQFIAVLINKTLENSYVGVGRFLVWKT